MWKRGAANTFWRSSGLRPTVDGEVESGVLFASRPDRLRRGREPFRAVSRRSGARLRQTPQNRANPAAKGMVPPGGFDQIRVGLGPIRRAGGAIRRTNRPIPPELPDSQAELPQSDLKSRPSGPKSRRSRHPKPRFATDDGKPPETKILLGKRFYLTDARVTKIIPALFPAIGQGRSRPTSGAGRRNPPVKPL